MDMFRLNGRSEKSWMFQHEFEDRDIVLYIMGLSEHTNC